MECKGMWTAELNTKGRQNTADLFAIEWNGRWIDNKDRQTNKQTKTIEPTVTLPPFAPSFPPSSLSLTPSLPPSLTYTYQYTRKNYRHNSFQSQTGHRSRENRESEREKERPPRPWVYRSQWERRSTKGTVLREARRVQVLGSLGQRKRVQCS